MATLKSEKLALKSTTAKPSSSRRYSTQQYTPTTHTTFSNRNQKNLHSWVNASFNNNNNNNNNGNGGKSSSKNPSTASTVSSSAKTASSKPKPFPKLLPLSRESSQSSSSDNNNNNNNSTNKEAVHRRLVNLFADINAFFAYKASSDAAAAASTSGPGGGGGGGGDHQLQATTSSIAHCRLRPLINRADALLARLDALLDDDAVLELLEDSTALGKLREYRLKLELRANTLGQLLEKRETRVKAQEEKAVAVAVEKLTAALISCSLNLKDQVSTEEPLPKYGGLATAAHQFPTWLVAVKDLVLDRAQLDDRAKFRRIFYALEDAADQRLISADADIESPDLCRVVKLLFNRHMGEGEEDGQGQEEEVGGGSE